MASRMSPNRGVEVVIDDLIHRQAHQLSLLRAYISGGMVPRYPEVYVYFRITYPSPELPACISSFHRKEPFYLRKYILKPLLCHKIDLASFSHILSLSSIK